MKTALQILAAILLLGGAGLAGWFLLGTAPETVPKEKRAAAKIVQVIPLVPREERIHVSAWGTVIPAREITMRPQVGGRIVDQNAALVPGGRLVEGEELIQIDPTDYQLNLSEKEAELENARFEREMEDGRQIIAKREWDQLRIDLPEADANPSLALREPHLRLADANVAKAKNAIERAGVDLDRTVLNTPFNSMVVAEGVEIGQLVEAGDEVCKLVGTDAFWVQVTLPVADLQRIVLPANGEPGAEAEIHLDTGNGKVEPWTGRVIRLLPDLETRGRMARVLVEVSDPMNAANEGENGAGTPLLLGSYVRVDIDAGRLADVLSVPRESVREGNRLWLVGADDRVRIVEPEILWTFPDTVLVPNLFEEGERLIVSELKAALPEMAVLPRELETGEADSPREE